MTKVKPNLFIPGAAKSGTSSLHEYLNQHPDIFMSKNKEPHFFSHDERYHSEEESEKYYHLFDKGKNFKYRGESSTGYMVFPNTILRIKKDITNPKFIFVLRNPIDRIFSHYNWIKSLGGEINSFEDAVLIDFNDNPVTKTRYKFGYRNYFQYGLYGKWIEDYFKNFGKENVLILFSEDLKKSPLCSINKCCRFLGLTDLSSLEEISLNQTEQLKKPKLFRSILNFFNKPIIHRYIEKKLPTHIFEKYKELRHNIFLKVKRIFLRKYPDRLTSKQRIWLKNLYSIDVKNLKKMIKEELNIWDDFEK